MLWKTAAAFVAPRLLRPSSTSRASSTIYGTANSLVMSPGNAPDAAAAPADPHLWLEDVLGEKQLAWVEEENRKCIAAVGDPKETESYARIKAILDSKVSERFAGRWRCVHFDFAIALLLSLPHATAYFLPSCSLTCFVFIFTYEIMIAIAGQNSLRISHRK